jgi:hypothetical protein
MIILVDSIHLRLSLRESLKRRVAQLLMRGVDEVDALAFFAD